MIKFFVDPFVVFLRTGTEMRYSPSSSSSHYHSATFSSKQFNGVIVAVQIILTIPLLLCDFLEEKKYAPFRISY